MSPSDPLKPIKSVWARLQRPRSAAGSSSASRSNSPALVPNPGSPDPPDPGGVSLTSPNFAVPVAVPTTGTTDASASGTPLPQPLTAGDPAQSPPLEPYHSTAPHDAPLVDSPPIPALVSTSAAPASSTSNLDNLAVLTRNPPQTNKRTKIFKRLPSREKDDELRILGYSFLMSDSDSLREAVTVTWDIFELAKVRC
jgi:hypothetical protein